MRWLKLKITPYSSFVTFPKGDTIFGHFAYHTFLSGDNIFEEYTEEKPKIIFSDILPESYLYKPTLPLESFEVEESQKKEFRKKAWLKIENLHNGGLKKAESLTFYSTNIKTRNTLNRVTFTTDDSGIFAPYSLEEIRFLHQPVIYILYDKPFSKEIILERFNQIGKVGFGKKGSIGKGHFKAELDNDFNGFDEVDEVDSTSYYYMTLSPTILNRQTHIKEAYYNTFNRFGKSHSSSTPFKKPILMADSGAVIKLEEKRTYIGRGVENGINKQSLVQGYSILVPFKFDGKGLKNGKEKK